MAMQKCLGAAFVAVLFAAGAFPADSSASSSSYRRGELTLLTGNGGRVDWSADGSTIFFDRADAGGTFDVWSMAPDGSGQQCRTCAHLQLPSGRHRGNPVLHPGGRWLVFQAEKGTHATAGSNYTAPGLGLYNDLWVLDLDTNDAIRLTDVSAACLSLVLHPQFNHDGTRLLWMHAPGAGACAALDDGVLAVADFVTSPSPHLENVA